MISCGQTCANQAIIILREHSPVSCFSGRETREGKGIYSQRQHRKAKSLFRKYLKTELLTFRCNIDIKNNVLIQQKRTVMALAEVDFSENTI